MLYNTQKHLFCVFVLINFDETFKINKEMKQPIPQLKIDEAAKEYALLKNNEHEITFMLSKSDFKSGVQFALNKIQPLMVELLDWSSTNYTSMDGLHCKIGDNNVEKWIDSQQLLEEFINSKNK